METQIDVPLPISQDDSLQSFSSINPDTQTGTTTTRDVAMEREVSDIIECECGVTVTVFALSCAYRSQDYAIRQRIVIQYLVMADAGGGFTYGTLQHGARDE